jgi:hypothetical protein
MGQKFRVTSICRFEGKHDLLAEGEEPIRNKAYAGCKVTLEPVGQLEAEAEAGDVASAMEIQIAGTEAGNEFEIGQEYILDPLTSAAAPKPSPALTV